MEFDEKYWNQYLANLKTWNTKNPKKYQAEAVPNDDPGNDTSKNWNNNVRPTADGIDKPGSKNWNNIVRPTTDDTEKSVSTNSWVTRLTMEANDFVSKATKKMESGDISVSRSVDSIAPSHDTGAACTQYAQRLAERVSSLTPEEIHVIIDDISSNAPNQSIYEIMMQLYGDDVDEELISWMCNLLEKRGHHTIISSVLSNCKEGYDARGFYQRYSYMFGAGPREMLFIAANMPDLATWSYHAVTNLRLANTAVTVWQNGITLLQAAYRCSPDDPFYALETAKQTPSQLVH
jgi:hypothetical protein